TREDEDDGDEPEADGQPGGADAPGGELFEPALRHASVPAQTPVAFEGPGLLHGAFEGNRGIRDDRRPQSDGDAALAPLLRGPDADDGDDEADEDEAVDASADAHAHLGGVGDVFEDHAEDEQRPGDGLGDGEELEEA